MSRQVEWIGVKSPLQDPRITMRKIRGMYTDEEEILLEAVATIVGPLTRQYKSTARALGRAHGFSKDYLWGPRWFVVDMEDIDADRLFAMEDTEFEFRDHGNPAHDTRTPVVPWMYQRPLEGR